MSERWEYETRDGVRCRRLIRVGEWERCDTREVGACESCEAPATTSLPDGSHWCDACDRSADDLGYRRVKLVDERPWGPTTRLEDGNSRLTSIDVSQAVLVATAERVALDAEEAERLAELLADSLNKTEDGSA